MLELLVTTLLFFIGFFFLVKGSDWIIDGASSLAKQLGISTWLIGVTVVGFGTSIPEFMVALLGNLRGAPSIGLGTVIGSNTFNILFIVGLCALITPLRLKRQWVHRDMPVNILAILLAGLFLEFSLVSEGGLFETALIMPGVLSIARIEGFFLLLFFLIWLSWLYKRDGPSEKIPHEGASIEALPYRKSLFLVLAGGVGVFLGGEWVINGGKLIGEFLNLSRSFVGLVIVGLGTSIPELAVSVRAAYRKDVGIAVGNIIGSNIFDFLFIIGAVAMIEPIVFAPELGVDIVVTFGAAVMLLLLSYRKTRYILNKRDGLALIATYLLYLLYLLFRG